MRIEVSTDPQIDVRKSLVERVYAVVEMSVGPHADRITEIDVHLGDESETVRTGSDVYCALEIRVRGRRIRAIRRHAKELERAIASAATELRRLLEGGASNLATAH